MTQPQSLFGAAEAASAYETNLVSRVFLPYAEKLVDLVSPTKDEDVLDLACGTGAVTRIVAARCGPGRVTGVDLTEAMLAVARSLVPEVTFLQGAFDALPVADASADVVLCQQGLQFAPDRPAAVAEMARVLRPGGRIAVSCWTDVSDQPVFKAFRTAVLELGWDDLAQSFAAPFSLPGDELQSLFSSAAFTDVTTTPVTLRLPVGEPREMARIYASVPPFSTRFMAASEAEQQRYLDTASAGVTDTEPFTTSLLTARRADS
jgi:ubiquinone/menaquinone biosynthesis C-methylase UbiE